MILLTLTCVSFSTSRGLEWMNLSVLLSFAHSSSGSAKSEIQMIDRLTGGHLVIERGGLDDSFMVLHGQNLHLR